MWWHGKVFTLLAFVQRIHQSAVTSPHKGPVMQRWSLLGALSPNKLFNTLRPGQNGRHFADDIFKCIFSNENVWISIKISLKFVPKGPINNIPALVQIMVWRRPGDKPLSEPVMARLPTHICVTRPQWVNKQASFWWFETTWCCVFWFICNKQLFPTNHVSH